jgi:hypothetical protein
MMREKKEMMAMCWSAVFDEKERVVLEEEERVKGRNYRRRERGRAGGFVSEGQAGWNR